MREIEPALELVDLEHVGCVAASESLAITCSRRSRNATRLSGIRVVYTHDAVRAALPLDMLRWHRRPPSGSRRARLERGVAVFALTDHDTCAGSGVAVAGARTIRGVEMSCDDGGRTIHVLAYDRGGDWATLESKLDAVREARRNRLRVMAAKLVPRGIRIDIEPLGRPGRAALDRPPRCPRGCWSPAGAVSSVKDAFARHLYDGGPVDVPHRNLPLDERPRGRPRRRRRDVCLIAHPGLYDDREARSLIRRYKPAGLTGLEAFCGAYDPRERARWIALADQLGLTCTGGSDWHGPDDAVAQPGKVDLPDDRSDALLRWLASTLALARWLLARAGVALLIRLPRLAATACRLAGLRAWRAAGFAGLSGSGGGAVWPSATTTA